MADTLLDALDRVKRQARTVLVLQVVNLVLTGIVLVWVWCCR